MRAGVAGRRGVRVPSWGGGLPPAALPLARPCAAAACCPAREHTCSRPIRVHPLLPPCPEVPAEEEPHSPGVCRPGETGGTYAQRGLLGSSGGFDEQLGQDDRKACLYYGTGLWVEQNQGIGGGSSSNTAELTYDNPAGTQVGPACSSV